MRIRLEIDSASAEEARTFLVAYQIAARDADFHPHTGGDREGPTVRMMGIGWGITTPAMPTGMAEHMMRQLT